MAVVEGLWVLRKGGEVSVNRFQGVEEVALEVVGITPVSFYFEAFAELYGQLVEHSCGKSVGSGFGIAFVKISEGL